MTDDKPNIPPGGTIPVAPEGPGSSPIVAPEPSGQGKEGTWTVGVPRRAAMDHLTLDRKLQSIFNATYNGDLGSIISDLQQWPMLYAICYWIDRAGAVIIFWDPNHTISYNIAIRAKAGEGWAIDMCGVLNLLSPNHCEWALQNEGLLRLP